MVNIHFENGELKMIEPRNPEFNKLLDRMLEIHDAKNKDYAEAGDLYKNFRETEDLGIPACITKRTLDLSIPIPKAIVATMMSTLSLMNIS